MRIFHATSELYPYSKTGGLADMVGGLAKSLARHGEEVAVITPLYRGIRENHPGILPTPLRIEAPLGCDRHSARIWKLEAEPRLTVYFVDHPDFFDRPGIYADGEGCAFLDNDARFIFFAKCVVEFCRAVPEAPDVLHLHEWQLGIAAPLIHHQRTREAWRRPPVVGTAIHNLNYQGVFPFSTFQLTNLPLSYFHIDGVEYFGGLNCLKSGIVYADFLTTVSPRYSKEITTREFGANLDGILKRRQGELTGILNGVDYDEWNTTENPCLAQAYDRRNPKGKAACKSALQKELGLPLNPRAPLFATVSRLEAYQKGIDTLLDSLQAVIPKTVMQFALLGTGEKKLEKGFRQLARSYPDKVAVRIDYDHSLAHRIEAGSDFFVMPSRYEPCGLNQLYSLRYGSIPVVSATGGLDDSITDISEDPDLANGIKMRSHSVESLNKAIRFAKLLFANPKLMKHFQQNGMKADFSWTNTAKHYIAVYSDALEAQKGRKQL